MGVKNHDGLSSDDHQLETIILRMNLLTAVHCIGEVASQHCWHGDLEN